MDEIREEDAAKLQLGPEFHKQKDITFLSISEVGFLLQHKQTGTDPNQLGDIFNKTLEYTQRFSRLKSKATIQESLSILERYSLAPYEAAQISNLFPDNYEEAVKLIPSLQHYKEEEIKSLLDDLMKLRRLV